MTTPSPASAARFGTILFEYVGKTGLTVLGPISGKRYRFNETGSRQEVDARDLPALFAVPNLRRV